MKIDPIYHAAKNKSTLKHGKKHKLTTHSWAAENKQNTPPKMYLIMLISAVPSVFSRVSFLNSLWPWNALPALRPTSPQGVVFAFDDLKAEIAVSEKQGSFVVLGETAALIAWKRHLHLGKLA